MEAIFNFSGLKLMHHAKIKTDLTAIWYTITRITCCLRNHFEPDSLLKSWNLFERDPPLYLKLKNDETYLNVIHHYLKLEAVHRKLKKIELFAPKGRTGVRYCISIRLPEAGNMDLMITRHRRSLNLVALQTKHAPCIAHLWFKN